MREALFRVAQTGGFYRLEDTVGRYQDPALTGQVHARSFRSLDLDPPPPAAGPRLIVWPHPVGTSDLIDRANCADTWLRNEPEFDLLTSQRLADEPEAARDSAGRDTLLFADFDTVLAGIGLDEDEWRRGIIRWHGRPVTALLDELTLGHILRRHGRGPDLLRHFAERPAADRTRVLNGTTIALYKAAQHAHMANLAGPLAELGVRPVPYSAAHGRDEAVNAMCRLLAEYDGVVVRPFAASQGAGVSFLRDPGRGRADACAALLTRLEESVRAEYRADGGYPVTLTPWYPTRRILGRVTDLRMFVVYDSLTGGVHALPGVVRCARTPLSPGDALTSGNACTSLGTPPDERALDERRMYPATSPETLELLGITPQTLIDLGQAATLMWSQAVKGASGFAYGSVDFGLLDTSANTGASTGAGAGGGRAEAVAFGMKGNNVGMHPSVHPRYLSRFADATLDGLRLSARHLPAPVAAGNAAAGNAAADITAAGNALAGGSR